MEAYKKKFDELMNSFDSWLSTIRMTTFCSFSYIAYANQLEGLTGIRKCYIGLIIIINIVLAVFFSLGVKTVGYDSVQFFII